MENFFYVFMAGGMIYFAVCGMYNKTFFGNRLPLLPFVGVSGVFFAGMYAVMSRGLLPSELQNSSLLEKLVLMGLIFFTIPFISAVLIKIFQRFIH